MTQKTAAKAAPPRVARVTGAARGLGFAMAEPRELRGWQLGAVARSGGGLEAR